MESSFIAFALIPAAAALMLPLLVKKQPYLADAACGLTFLAGLVNIILAFFSFISSESASPAPSAYLNVFLSGIFYLLGFCITMYASAKMADKTGRVYFFSMLLFSISALCGAITADNFFSLYLYIELLTLAIAAILSIYKENGIGLDTALNWLVLSLPASVLCLLGNVLLFCTLGSTSFEKVNQLALSGDPFGPSLFALAIIIFAFLLKAAIFLVPQEKNSNTQNELATLGYFALMLGRIGCMYAVFRIAILLRFSFGNADGLSFALMIIGSAIMLLGAFASGQVKNIKAYACMIDASQIGVLLLAIGVSTSIAVVAALISMLSISQGTSLLLLCGGILNKNCRNKKQGFCLFLIGSLSQAGLPPFLGFWSRLLVIMALFDSERYIFGALVLIAGIIVLVSTLRQKNNIANKIAISEPNYDERQKDKTLVLKEKLNAVLKLMPAWLTAIILFAAGCLFPFIYIYIHITAGSLFL